MLDQCPRLTTGGFFWEWRTRDSKINEHARLADPLPCRGEPVRNRSTGAADRVRTLSRWV